MATTPEDAGLESSAQEFSLADLAGLDVSGIEEIRSERLPAGMFLFKGKAVSLSEMQNRDDEKRFLATVTLEVAEVQALLDNKIDSAGLVGKTHTERFYIVPEKAEEGIGRIRAFVSDIGLNSAGPLGGMTSEGVPPGILDSIVDHVFPGKIVDKKQDGENYARLKLTKKAA